MKAIFFLDKTYPSNHSFVDDFLKRYFHADELLLVYQKSANAQKVNRGRATDITCEVTLPRRLLSRFLNIYVVCKFLLNNDSYEIVLVRNCPAMLLGAKVFCLFRRASAPKLVYMSSYDHEGRASGLKRSVALLLHSILNRKVTGLLTVSDSGLKRVQQLYPTAAERLTIPLCSSIEGKPTFYRRAKSKGYSSFIYGGTFDPDREFDCILRAFQKFLISGECKLTLVGVDSNQVGLWRGLYPWLSRENLLVLPKLPRCEYLRLVENIDFGLSLVPKNKINEEMSPTKLLEYFTYGVPAIASDNVIFQRNVVSKYEAGILTAFEESEINLAIERAISMDPNEYERLAEGAMAAAADFSYRAYVEPFRNLCNLRQ